MIRLLIFLLAAGFGDTHNPSNASLPIWLRTSYVRRLNTLRILIIRYEVSTAFSRLPHRVGRGKRGGNLPSKNYDTQSIMGLL